MNEGQIAFVQRLNTPRNRVILFVGFFLVTSLYLIDWTSSSSFVTDYISTPFVVNGTEEILPSEKEGTKDNKTEEVKEKEMPSIWEQDIGFFIRTYHADAHFLPYLWASMKKYTPEWQDVVITFPETDRQAVEPYLANAPAGLKVFGVIDTHVSPKGGYDDQQFTKMDADFYLSNKWIIHLDSDMVINHRPIYTDLFNISTGRMMITYDTWTPGEMHWRNGVSWFLGIPEDKINNFMRRSGMFHRDAYHILRRKLALKHQGLSMTEIWRNKHPDQHGAQMSEYNLLGTALWFDNHDLVDWVFAPEAKHPAVRTWFWSWGYNGGGGQYSDLDGDFCRGFGEQPGCLAKWGPNGTETSSSSHQESTSSSSSSSTTTA